MVCARLGDGQMQVFVEGEVDRQVGFLAARHRLDAGPEIGQHRWVHATGGTGAGFAFQEPAQLQQVEIFADGWRGHHVESVGQALEHSLAVQAAERDPQRRARNVQYFGQWALLDDLPAGQFALEDHR